MTSKLAIFAVLATAASPAFAAGDATKGEATFKQCQTCHSVVNEAGEVLAGKGSKTGPNLYGVIGRQVGSYPDFKYGESIVAAGATGLVWDEAGFIDYVQDPANHWKTVLNDKGAKSKMMFKVKNAEAAADVYAYLLQFSPAAEAPADAAAAPAATTTP
ncbi:cytochrome c2 [Paracoccaceae bacterium]